MISDKATRLSLELPHRTRSSLELTVARARGRDALSRERPRGDLVIVGKPHSPQPSCMGVVFIYHVALGFSR